MVKEKYKNLVDLYKNVMYNRLEPVWLQIRIRS